MDFAAVLSALASDLERNNVRFAVVGAVALAALGMPRTTIHGLLRQFHDVERTL